MERITVGDLIARIEPRLRRRCEEVDLTLEVSVPSDIAARTINVDAMGVEQIFFNLVNNACKYAAPKSDPRTLHLELSASGPRLAFRVRDHGPGISKQQQKRLFQPFEKPATDAAHSAPRSWTRPRALPQTRPRDGGRSRAGEDRKRRVFCPWSGTIVLSVHRRLGPRRALEPQVAERTSARAEGMKQLPAADLRRARHAGPTSEGNVGGDSLQHPSGARPVRLSCCLHPHHPPASAA